MKRYLCTGWIGAQQIEREFEAHDQAHAEEIAASLLSPATGILVGELPVVLAAE